jgi:hypothetical protein
MASIRSPLGLLLCLFALATGPALATEAAPSAADVVQTRRLLGLLRSPRTSPSRVEESVADLVALGATGEEAIERHLERELRRLTEVVDSRPATDAFDAEIDTLRGTLARLRADPDLSKEQLKAEGMPALEALTAVWGRREASLAGWHRKCTLALEQIDRLAAILNAWEATGTGGSAGSAFEAQGEELRGRLTDGDPEIAAVFAENETIAKSLPAELVPGMTAVNTIRITCGLNPLVFDPKLCQAAAMHSSDMESHDFFAHESPLPGKKTPWDRAAIAGTTASGENIYMGSTVGSDAIKAWFLSPGHHKNMFGEGHTRQGLGRAGKYWTQLFGN